MLHIIQKTGALFGRLPQLVYIRIPFSWRPGHIRLNHYPFTAPSMMPETKYFCRNG